MTSNKKKVSSKKKKGSKTYTFNFTFSGLCSLSLLTIIVMVWIFIFGILVGRGYQPESFFPQLAEILPGSSKESPAKVSENNHEEILTAEELGFYEELESVKDKPNSKDIKQAPKSLTEEQESTSRTEKTEKNPSVSQGPDKDEAQRYAYIYQVSAFQDLAKAKRIRAQLRKLGLPSSLKTIKKEGATWHRIYVPFKGRPGETRKLKAKLRTLGIKKPFLRSKKEL